MLQEVTEHELVAKAVGERVSLYDVEVTIAYVDFSYNDTLTICIITLTNGFKVIGESACAIPANYNRDIGERLAFGKAKEKIWQYLGYMLCEKHHRATKPFIERVLDEHKDLDDKVEKLTAFLVTDVFQTLDEKEQADLEAQLNLMVRYRHTLGRRIDRYNEKLKADVLVDDA